MKVYEREKDPTLKEIIEKEIAMVNKNRWLTEKEKRIKVKQLQCMLNNDK